MTPTVLTTARLRLEPLRVDHAPAMAAVLADPALYAFTGGEPPTGEQLAERYARQVAGRSPDGREWWLNWVVVLDDAPVGYVQATVTGPTAYVAWVVGSAHQGRGVATEAASAMADWLAGAVVRRLVASIHPDHDASARVAAHLGLVATGEVDDDGEVQWVRELAFEEPGPGEPAQ